MVDILYIDLLKSQWLSHPCIKLLTCKYQPLMVAHSIDHKLGVLTTADFKPESLKNKQEEKLRENKAS